MLVIAVCENTEKHEVTVKCSGENYLVTQADFLSLGICEGNYLDEDQIELLEQYANKLKCIKTAFSMLSYNDMSSGKLRRKLSQKYDKETASLVTDMMLERGYINDTSLAARYAENFYSSKRWGPARIKSELFSRGFSSMDIDDALEIIENNDHSENIRYLLEHKYSKEQLSDREVSRKAAAYLYRCGYESSDIYEIINQIYQE